MLYVSCYFLYNCNRRVRVKMIKMIFSDFDNTMLDYYGENNYFDDYQIGVLKKLEGKNIKFCIVTGRSVTFFYRFPILLEIIDYIIGSNGACIYDVKNETYIYQRSIGDNELSKIINYSIEHDYSFLLNCLDKRYKYGDWDRVDGLIYENNKQYKCEQMVLSFDKKDSDEVANYIQFLNNIIVNNVTDWGSEYSLDINVKGVSKGSSIVWLCERLNIQKKETIGFGDGANDISMFDVVGKSISVDNALDGIKAQADDISLECEDYGIYKYIEENILK